MSNVDIFGPYDPERAIISKDNRIDYAEAKAPSAPIPLRPEPQPPQDYPVDAFGAYAKTLEIITATVKCPTALAAGSLLTGIAAAVQDIAAVDVDGRQIPPSLFAMCVAISGERKSECDRLAKTPHEDYERSLLAQYQADMKQHKIELAAYMAAKKATETNKTLTTRREKLDAMQGLGEDPKEPVSPTFIVDNVNSEGVFRMCKEGQRKLGIFCDEAGSFFGGHGMTAENVLKTITFFSKLHDGSPIDKIRSGEGTTKLYGRRCSMHLLIQPIVAVKVLSDPILSGQGFLPRFLLSWPLSTVGTRAYSAVNITNAPEYRLYCDAVKRALEHPRQHDENGEPAHAVMTLTSEAKQEFIAYHNHIEEQLAPDAELSTVASYGSKNPDIAVRIAAIFALVDDPSAQWIGLEDMQRGIMLAQYYLSEALRISQDATCDPEILAAEKLLNWLKAKRYNSFTMGEIGNKVPNSLRFKKNLDPAIKTLMAHGWLVKNGNVFEVQS